MLYLLLCIVFSSSLILIFRLYHKYHVSVTQAIFFNYLTCTAIGVFMLKDAGKNIAEAGLLSPWVLIGSLCGFIFFITFYLIAESTKKAGMAATSVAQKVSLVVPVAASLLLWQKGSLNFLMLAGLIMAVAAVVLSSWKRKVAAPAQAQKKTGVLAALLPVFVFANAGLVDTLINYTNYKYLNPELEPAFTLVLFGTAAILGFVVQLYQWLVHKKGIALKSIPAGVLLGIPNLLSLVFLLKSLTAFQNNGAFVYPVNNIGVIVLSTAAGIFLFGEKLLKVNWIGLGLALLALGLLLAEQF